MMISRYLKANLFIKPNGKFYKVDTIHSVSTGKSISHEQWAENYLKQKEFGDDLKARLLSIAQKDPNWNHVSVMIHLLGFVYYSHDHELRKPIIEKPNPKYFERCATEEQMDSLFSVMLYNKENPMDCPIFEEDVLGFVQIENRITYKEGNYETDFREGFRKL